MKNCPKCNANCQENQEACESCGYSFAEENLEPEVVREEPISFQEEKEEKLPKMTKDQVYEVTEDTIVEDQQLPVEATEPVSGNKGKGNKLIIGLGIIGAVALIAIISILTFGKSLFKSADPEDLIVDAFKQYQKATAQDVTVEISVGKFKLNEMLVDQASLDLINKIVEDFSITIRSKGELASKRFEGSYGVNLKGSELLKATVYTDSKNIGVRIPAVYDKGFYVAIEDLQDNLAGPMQASLLTEYMEVLDINTYDSIKKLSKDIVEKPVKVFIKKNLNTVTKEAVKIGDKSVKCTKYPLSFRGSEGYDLVEEIINNFMKDEQARNVIIEALEKITTVIEENDLYSEMEITKDELDTMLTTVRVAMDKMDKENKTLDDLLSESNSLEYAQAKMAIKLMLASIQTDLDVYLDKNDKLRKVDMGLGIDIAEMGIEFQLNISTLINSFDKKLEFMSVDKDKDINVLELSDEEQVKIGEEVMKNIEKNFSNNPYLKEILGGLPFNE